MKIVLTAHQFLPEYSAGTEVLTLETARALRSQGHSVSIFTSSPKSQDNGHCKDYVFDGFDVRCYVPRTVDRSWPYDAARHEFDDATMSVLFEAYLAEKKPDVVHFFHLARLTASALQATDRLGIAAVFTPTDFWAVCPAMQLRLPDNSVCPGADSNAGNCIKHMLRTIRPAKRLRFLTQLPNPVLTLLLPLLTSTPLVMWRPARNLRSLQHRLPTIRELFGTVERMFIPSKIMFDMFIREGYPAEKMTLSRFGLVNARKYPPHRRRDAGTSPVVAFIGTLSIHKGAHVLVKAIKSLPKDYGFLLKLYGSELSDPSYSAELRRIVDNDPRVVFAGEFPNAEIGHVLADVDVLCIPSIWLENTPLVLLSAQAAGVPVIATNVGGMSELVHDAKNGFLFPAGDHIALASIIEKIIRDPAVLPALTKQVVPPKDIDDYARECAVEYSLAIAARRQKLAADEIRR